MTVTGYSAPGLSALLKTDKHEFMSGVGAALGGGEQGMDPHELLQASLTACTLITLQMYIGRKGWSVGTIEVRVSVGAESLEASTLRREIRFSGEESAEQRVKMLEIADKCPIHLLLESQISIETVTLTE